MLAKHQSVAIHRCLQVSTSSSVGYRTGVPLNTQAQTIDSMVGRPSDPAMNVSTRSTTYPGRVPWILRTNCNCPAFFRTHKTTANSRRRNSPAIPRTPRSLVASIRSNRHDETYIAPGTCTEPLRDLAPPSIEKSLLTAGQQERSLTQIKYEHSTYPAPPKSSLTYPPRVQIQQGRYELPASR